MGKWPAGSPAQLVGPADGTEECAGGPTMFSQGSNAWRNDMSGIQCVNT